MGSKMFWLRSFSIGDRRVGAAWSMEIRGIKTLGICGSKGGNSHLNQCPSKVKKRDLVCSTGKATLLESVVVRPYRAT